MPRQGAEGSLRHAVRAAACDLARLLAAYATEAMHAVIEEAMGHQVGAPVERAYRRTDVLEKRRELMTAWASYCDPDGTRDHSTLTVSTKA